MPHPETSTLIRGHAKALAKHAASPEKKRPSTLAEQVAQAQAEYDSWSPERKAGVQLQGTPTEYRRRTGPDQTW